VLGNVRSRFNWVVHAYCQMSNHYHLLVETVDGNRSRGMRQLNGHYTQRFNRRHGLVGHLFQGRYQAILVQKEAYLLELTRYVVLNPVRAGMVREPQDWPWSSYPAVLCLAAAAPWLDTDWLLGQFARRRGVSRKAYQRFLTQREGVPGPLGQTRHQLLLGDDAFVDRFRADAKSGELRELLKAHKRTLARSLEEYQRRYADRDEPSPRPTIPAPTR